MNLLPRRALLGILVVLDVALSGKKPLPASEFATRHKLPPRHLEALLQAMVHNGMLTSIRGPSGGYVLGRDSKHISLGSIARLTQTLRTINPDHYVPKSRLFDEIIKPSIQNASHPFLANLDTISIATLCGQAVLMSAFEQNIEKNDSIKTTA